MSCMLINIISKFLVLLTLLNLIIKVILLFFSEADRSPTSTNAIEVLYVRGGTSFCKNHTTNSRSRKLKIPK